MFLMLLVFSVVLVLTFGVVLLMTRPTSAERTIAGRIAKLHSPQNVVTALEDAASPLMKQTHLSTIPRLDVLLQRWRLMSRIQLLVEQGESNWTVAGVLGCSLALGFVGYGIGCYQLSSALIALLPASVLAASRI